MPFAGRLSETKFSNASGINNAALTTADHPNSRNQSRLGRTCDFPWELWHARKHTSEVSPTLLQTLVRGPQTLTPNLGMLAVAARAGVVGRRDAAWLLQSQRSTHSSSNDKSRCCSSSSIFCSSMSDSSSGSSGGYSSRNSIRSILETSGSGDGK